MSHYMYHIAQRYTGEDPPPVTYIDWEREGNGHPNFLPQPAVRVTEREFLFELTGRGWQWMENRQVSWNGDAPQIFGQHRVELREAHIYYWDDTAIAQVVKRSLGAGGHVQYETEYWRLGCEHPNMKVGWREMHTRVDTCPDCGFKAEYDTSG